MLKRCAGLSPNPLRIAVVAGAAALWPAFAFAQMVKTGGTGVIDPPLPVEECHLEGGPQRMHDRTLFHSTEPVYQGYPWPTEDQHEHVVSSCPTGGAAGSDDCLRLNDNLRRIARGQDAVAALTEAALEFYRAGGAAITGAADDVSETPHETRAVAFADLAVTGRGAYASFVSAAPTLRSRIETALRARIDDLDSGHEIDEAALANSIGAAINRAYEVAWVLRGPIAERDERRARLGWIAVSAEDDPPHRPVNAPSAPYPQDDITVPTPAADGTIINITARYYVATVDGEPSWTRADLGAFPVLERPPEIGVSGPILIYLHGLGSRAEEANDILDPPHPEGLIPVRRGLLELARAQGRRVTVISLDMPTRGYSTHVPHTSVAPSAASNWNTGYPWLDFNEEFVVRFVREMEERHPGFKRRLVGVMGGSLGGNLTLRIAERASRDEEVAVWARRNAAWSAAAVWPSFGPACITVDCRGEGNRSFYDHAKHEAVRISRDKYNAAEDGPAKRHFLYDIIKGVDSIDRGPIGSQGSNRWYRDSWQPCKFIFRNRARRELNEVYSPAYRRWHFRGAHEQLIFSHQDQAGSELENPPNPRWASLSGYLLFMAGAEDNHIPEFLADNTLLIADSINNRGLTTVQGEVTILRETGHSIHNERPGYLAEMIVKHLLEPEWRRLDEEAAMAAARSGG